MKQTLCETRFLRLVENNGWTYAERSNASGVVVIVAVNPRGQLLLTEQFRIPVGTSVIELPAGLVGDDATQSDEAIETAAGRELEEETGYAAQHLKVITQGPASAGLSSEVLSFVWASKLKKVGPGGGVEGENITLHAIAPSRLHRWLELRRREGVLIDPKVYAGLWFAEKLAPRRPSAGPQVSKTPRRQFKRKSKSSPSRVKR